MKKYLILLILIFGLILCGCNNPSDDGKKEDDIENNDEENKENNNEEEVIKPEEDTYQYKNTTLLLIDKENNYIELLGLSATKLTENTKIYKLESNNKNNKIECSFEDLMIGMNNLYVKTKNDEIVEEIIIDGEPVFSRMRVAIRNTITNISDINTLYHDTVDIYVAAATTIQTYDGKQIFPVKANTTINIKTNGEKINFYNGKVLNITNKRLIINGTDQPLKITSISRGSSCLYEGILELSLVDGRILVTNDLLMEDYLKKVVPSEMPASWNIEALKSQAVAARTYAYKEIYNKKYLEYGYIVDDSESSQVYNNSNEQESTNQAILETKGITMFCENEPIIAYYYSSSSGLCGAGKEVWIENKIIDDILYLQGGNTTDYPVDTSSEESLLEFFKTINMYSPSGSSSNFRWLITMNKEQLRQTLNVNLPLMVPNYKESYPILENGEWIIKDFPSDIGAIKNVFVSERGESGVVVSLQIEAENVTFRIYNQYNIRFTIRPKDCGSTVVRYNTKSNTGQYTSSSNNPSILTSGYFALEWNGDNLSFYGGGSGHGVGMCQYSANTYAKEGKTYQEILNVFYKNIEFRNTSSSYTPLTNFEKYFN